jgi:hypothetical protein
MKYWITPMFPPALGKPPSPLPLSRKGRGVRAQFNAERPIRASHLPMREKDRMRGKPQAEAAGASQ